MTPDDRIDGPLGDALRGYNEPPVVPRDAMWAAIEAARAPQTVVPLEQHPRRWRTTAWAAAAAALLLIGIGIGRFALRSPVVPVTPPTPVADGGQPSGAYRMAALEHFTRAEVLLTRLQTPDSPGENAADLDRWAWDLLQDTRLLLDSPAAADEQVHSLLEDLELVLAQLAQANAQNPQARRWVADGVRQQGVMERLQLVAPTTPARARTPGV